MRHLLIATGSVALLATPAFAETTCLDRVQYLVEAVSADEAWPEIEREFSGMAEEATIFATRGEDGNCYAALSEMQRYLADRKIAVATIGGGAAGAEMQESRADPDVVVHSAVPDVTIVQPPPSVTVVQEAPSVTVRQEEATVEFQDAARGGADRVAVTPVAEILVQEVTFGFDEAEISAEARRVLQKVAEVAAEKPEARLLLSGHTDSVGPAEYNMDLSQRRVAAVAEALAALGIGEDRIETRHFGQKRPRVETPESEREQSNRRVEIRVLDASS